MNGKCLFVDQLRSKRQCPCNKCCHQKNPFKAQPMETRSHCEWWVAELKDGRIITFRCFPTSKKGLPRSAKKRHQAIKNEYRQDMKSARACIEHRYRDHQKRGKLWELPATNAVFSRLFGEPKGFRPAYPCEVMAWMSGHKSDFFALKDGEKLLQQLEEFI